MNIQVLPKSTSGKWAAGLCISFFAFLGLFFVFIAAGQRGSMKFFDNLTLALPIAFAGLTGSMAFFMSLISIIKYKERSVSIFITMAIGIFVLSFTIGELAGEG